MSKKLHIVTGKVNHVSEDSVLMNIGKELGGGKTLAIRNENFKELPGKGDMVEFECSDITTRQFADKNTGEIHESGYLMAHDFKVVDVKESDVEETRKSIFG